MGWRWMLSLAACATLAIAGVALSTDGTSAVNGPFYTFTLPNPPNVFGSAVAAGDVNADGKADLVVGAFNETVGGYDGQGQVYVFSGATGLLLYTLASPTVQAGAHFGRSVAVGDVDGDGKKDIIVGADAETVGFNAFQGRVYVFSGATGLLIYTLDTPNPESFASFGISVAAGDTNGDGKADIVVGSYGETVAANTGQGRAYVFSGLSGSLLRTFTTPNPEALAQFGLSVATGDLNADGKADVIVGAGNETVGANASEGRAYSFSGATGSLLFTYSTPNHQASAQFGYSVAAGDTNFDGKADVIVGAIGETVGGNSAQGRAYVFSGANGSVLRTWTTPNPQSNAQFGISVDAADFNADGRADVVVGAEGETVSGNVSQGRAYVYSGAAGGIMYTITSTRPEANGRFGIAVAAGDTNGDGTPDILVGASNETVAANPGQGRVYAFNGATTAALLVVTSPNRFYSTESPAAFGNSVAVGDVNLDGKADVVIGAPTEIVGFYAGQGRVFVHSGADRSTLLTLTTPNPQSNARFGQSVAVGDTNGDLVPDVVVGAYNESGGAFTGLGHVYVFSGVNGALLRTLVSPNPENGAHFGIAVAVRDTDGDGKADIIVGAPGETVGGNAGQGRAYVFSGATGAVLRTLVSPNPEANASFGLAVAGGDVNNDARADIVVGSTGETVAGNAGQGRAYVFSGRDGSLLRTLTSPAAPQPGGAFGSSVAVGNLNGDVNGDIVVGADGETTGGNAGQGAVYGFSGLDGSVLRTLTTPNPAASAQFGYSVAVGDVSADGIADIAVGAIGETVGGNLGQGREYTFSGADGSLLRTDTTPNAGASAMFGYATALGDVNGDAKADIVVGAQNETVGGALSQGRAYVFAGVSAPDTDGDGCSDPMEPLLGLDYTNPWDFYSVPVPAMIAAVDPTLAFADSAVSASDAQAVFAYFKAGSRTGEASYEQDLNLNGVKDGIEYDRSVAGSGKSGPPDGVIGASDAQLAFAQFKAAYHC
jgi:hypothetical protein